LSEPDLIPALSASIYDAAEIARRNSSVNNLLFKNGMASVDVLKDGNSIKTKVTIYCCESALDLTLSKAAAY
jgi:hypothetical protein